MPDKPPFVPNNATPRTWGRVPAGEDAMGTSEYAVALAERHVQEAEERVARQAAIAAGLDEAGHGWAADEARKMLEPMQITLNIARSHLVIVRALLHVLPDA